MDSPSTTETTANNATVPANHPASLRDPEKLNYQQAEVRRSIILSYWLVIFLVLPVWWYTTSIERLSLPSSRIQQAAQHTLIFPITICIDSPDINIVQNVERLLQTRILQDRERWNGLDVTVKSKEHCGRTHENVYTVVSSPGPVKIHDRQISVPLMAQDSAIRLVDFLTSLLVPFSNSNDREHRVAQYSPQYKLAFSLLNEDASAGGEILGWELQSELKAYIYPIIHHLNALHNFTIESQVQYHAPLAFVPRPTGDGYGLTQEELTVFINSAEWTLSSSSSNDPVLHFVLFIPSASSRPLRILNDDGQPSEATAFLLPQWGGIVIHNPTLVTVPNKELPGRDLDAVFASFSSQLLALLGVPSLPEELLGSGDSLLTNWQMDALVRRRTFENIKGSQDTLQSIIKLVDKIDNMPVGDDVQGDVEEALKALSSTYEASTSSLYEAFSFSAKSFGLASRAFFNPGMLALLYFPAEHKYAVYSPLFASAVIPLFVAAVREILAIRRERRTKKP